MATRFEIQVSSGGVTITVDGQYSATDAADGGNGKSSGTTSGGNGKSSGTGSGGNGKSSGTGSGGGEPGACDCSAPVVIGPIVISGGMLGLDGGAGGNGKSSGTTSGGNGKSSGTGSGGNGKSSGTGSGGGTPGSGGCSAPVVIGPIVISGCAGQGAADPSGCCNSTAVSVTPPAGLNANAWNQGVFAVEAQQETFWCWSAVAVSINAFLNPTLLDPLWTQQTLATALMQQQGNALADCTANPGGTVCNQPEPLNDALSITGNLMPNGAMFDQHLTFESLQQFFTAQLPVAARILWRGGGAHFIALDGCKVTTSGRQLVHVQDPDATASSSPGLWDYDVLVEDYQEAGCWNDSYLVVPAV
jgi:hypothetical protein